MNGKTAPQANCRRFAPWLLVLGIALALAAVVKSGWAWQFLAAQPPSAYLLALLAAQPGQAAPQPPAQAVQPPDGPKEPAEPQHPLLQALLQVLDAFHGEGAEAKDALRNRLLQADQELRPLQKSRKEQILQANRKLVLPVIEEPSGLPPRGTQKRTPEASPTGTAPGPASKAGPGASKASPSPPKSSSGSGAPAEQTNPASPGPSAKPSSPDGKPGEPQTAIVRALWEALENSSDVSEPYRQQLRQLLLEADKELAKASTPQTTASTKSEGETEAAELFPFVVAYEPSRGLPNLSAWLHRPAGKYGFVRVQREGDNARLVTQAGPIRFWATNLCFEACFPSREEAQRLAARLASLGINCVRLHHMDSRHIWGNSKNQTTIDPEMLDRLDYLIYQLQEHGIYTNINLHVSRWLDDRDGFPHRDRRPKYDKGLGNFEPRMIELQKKYARDLLRHVNPYTKLPYAENPAIAFVEISNEDALFMEWGGGHLDDLPDPYATTFRKLWNAWLRAKYGSTEKLRSAWQAGEYPLGQQMLQNGDFSKPPDQGWRMERDRLTDVSWSILPQGGPDNSRCLQVVVRRRGELPWNPQFSQAHLAVQKGTPYTLRFYARSPQPSMIVVNCMMAHEPWENLGLVASVALGPEWKEYSYTFRANRSDPNARITFTGLQPGTYELADVRLQPGGIVGLAKNERIEEDSVPFFPRWQNTRTPAALADWIDFLWDTERQYWHGMYRFLKEELGVRSLVSGTQLYYSPPYIQAGLDYIDAHSYWQHPHFPGRPWDPVNWTVRNIALVNSPGGTLAGLAERRILGHAFTVSEYNHPAPNVYAAEGFPMLAALAAFQGWDAIYSFDYSHTREFEPRRITGFFDIKSDPSRIVHAPACAAMFLRGDVQPAQKTYGVPVSLEQERQNLRQHQNARSVTAREFGLDPRLALLHAIGMKLVDPIPSALGEDSGGNKTHQVGGIRQGGPEKAAGGEKPLETGTEPASPSGLPTLDPQTTTFVSDTGQLRWDITIPNAGYFVVDTPRCKLFTGFVRGRIFRLGEVELRIGRTRLDWVTVSMTVLEGEGFRGPGRILLAATGWVQNTGATLKELGAEQVTLGNQWGQEPVLCEGVPAEVVVPAPPDRVKCYALDEAGQRTQEIKVEKSPTGQAVLRLGPQYKTLWYELEIR